MINECQKVFKVVFEVNLYHYNFYVYSDCELGAVVKAKKFLSGCKIVGIESQEVKK